MMSIETEDDLKALRRVGRVVSLALDSMRDAVRPGVRTAELDAIGERVIRANGARSAPRHVYGFPGWTCISVNDEVVHGVPGSRVLEEGDVVTLDVTAELDGYVADAARTVAVGRASDLVSSLIDCAEAAFGCGAAMARAGTPLSWVGREVEREVTRRGFLVLRELAGHGIGRTIHEPPAVFNYYDHRDRTILGDGLVIALEPIVCVGTSWTRQEEDGWTISSSDGSLTAHHEETIVVTRGEPIILTRN